MSEKRCKEEISFRSRYAEQNVKEEDDHMDVVGLSLPLHKATIMVDVVSGITRWIIAFPGNLISQAYG